MREGQSFPEHLCAATAPWLRFPSRVSPRCASPQHTARPFTVPVGRRRQRTDRTRTDFPPRDQEMPQEGDRSLQTPCYTCGALGELTQARP